MPGEPQVAPATTEAAGSNEAAGQAVAEQEIGSAETKQHSANSKAEKQIEIAKKLKEEGNACFKSGDLQGALTKWHHALLNSSGINSLSSQYGTATSEEVNKAAQEVTIAIQNNFGAIYLQQKKYEKCIYSTTKVLTLDDQNVKAYYRRAKAYQGLGQVQKAATDVDVAMGIAPNDPGVKTLAKELVKHEETKIKEAQKKMGGFLKGKSLGNDDA